MAFYPNVPVKILASACLAALFMSVSALSAASPTANEYLPCHQATAMTLQRCLDQRPGYKNDACWREAQQANTACYQQVKASHAPDPARIEAEKRARAAQGKP